MSNAVGDSGSIWDHKFVRFLLAGGFSAVVNFGSRFLYSVFFDFSTAIVLAFFTGLITAFVLNKRFVFTASKNSRTREITWFVIINLLALLQTWALSVYLVQWLPDLLSLEGSQGLGIAQAIAHGSGIILPVFTSYLGHKYLSFRE